VSASTFGPDFHQQVPSFMLRFRFQFEPPNNGETNKNKSNRDNKNVGVCGSVALTEWSIRGGLTFCVALEHPTN
jgi:hypothetical protein